MPSKERQKRKQDLIRKTQHQTYQFFMVDMNWQRQQCSNSNMNVCQTHRSLTKPMSCGIPVNIKTVAGDGNCFFRSISYLMTGSETNHQKVRALILAHMQRIETSMKKVLPVQNMTVLQYLANSNMDKLGTWGTEVEIYAAAHMLQTNIYIYTTYSSRNWRWMCHSGTFLEPSLNTHQRSLYLYHRHGSHYDVVLDVLPETPTPRPDAQPHLHVDTTQSTRSRKHYFMDYKRKQRQSEEYREKEKKTEKIGKDRRRADQEYRQNERTAEKTRIKKRRQSEQYREKEKKTEKVGKDRRRQSEEYRGKEKKTEKVGKDRRRADAKYRQNERTKERASAKKRRADETTTYRQKERTRDKEGHKKRRLERLPTTTEQAVQNFHDAVRCGPVYSCTSCRQLFYKHSVTNAHSARIKHVERFPECFTAVLPGGIEYICTTCSSHLNKANIPPCSQANGVLFPEIPPELDGLHGTELRLVAARLPFMKIQQAPRGKQFKLHGNVVNVPADVTTTVTTLPRVPDETATIKLRLKRRLQYKSFTHAHSIRPVRVQQAAKWLVANSSLYQKEGITFTETSFDSAQPSEVLKHPQPAQTQSRSASPQPADHFPSLSSAECAATPTTDATLESTVHQNHTSAESAHPTFPVIGVSDPTSTDEETHPTANPTPPQSTDQRDEIDQTDISPPEFEDQWSEIDETEISGILDTMLTSPDFVEESEHDAVYNVAPGEGSHPLSVFRDAFSEEMAFPGIYAGQPRRTNADRKVPLHYSELCKAEVRAEDRRVSNDIENIFFKAKKLQMKTLLDKCQLALRKYQKKDSKLTAGDIRTGTGIKNLIFNDSAYRVMRAIRGSPPYFEKAQKDLFAMIRVLGPATLFCSFSAAETRWLHLLSILGTLVDHKTYTEDELRHLSWENTCRLIQSDPVTCARHFDYQFNLLLTKFMKSPAAPLGHIADYFYRVEYQQRGSPHIHMVIWITDAPKYDVNSDEEVVDYIDRVITCEKPDEESDLHDLVKLQIHKHSHSCRKKGKNICRFNFPKVPVSKTTILKPLEPDEQDPQYKKWWHTIRDLLCSNKEGLDMSFQEYLAALNLSEDEYILAVRSSLRSATIFLRRSPSEIRVNAYNKACLLAWRANMDIQFVLDVYACAVYIASYVSKGQRGMSQLLQEAVKEAKQGNKDIKEQLRCIGNHFINSVELSAQEAVYLVLQLPMRKASRQVIFVNTSPPEDRVVLLKSTHQLTEMHEDDDDIEAGNILKRYSTRPRQLEQTTLADYAKYYDNTTPRKPPRKNRKASDQQFLPETDIQEENMTDDEEERPVPPLLGQPRKVPRIIRHVNYDPETQPELYYREQLMLYTPWRKEDTDLLKDFPSYKDRYDELQDAIQQQQKIHEPYAAQLDEAAQDLQNNPDRDDAWDELAPGVQQPDNDDEEEGAVDSLDFPCPLPVSNKQQGVSYDIGQDINRGCVQDDEDSCVNFIEMPDDEYRSHLRTLNCQQMEFLLDTLHHFKTTEEPTYRFLSGGAGVGKTHVLLILHQALWKFFNRQPGATFEKDPVLVLAPTGKAAFGIRGRTIHSALKIPINQTLQDHHITSKLDDLRREHDHVRVIFIDEISMVGSRLFHYIHKVFQRITARPKPFGGISVIAFGDLFQLQPVRDEWVFLNSKHNYSPLATNLWIDHFAMHELTTIMRQRDCKPFAEILNRLREGFHTEEDITTLNTRTIRQDDPQYPFSVPHLFRLNDDVDKYNEILMKRSSGAKYSIHAHDTLVEKVSPKLKKDTLEKLSTANPQRTAQLLTTLTLVEGNRYEISVNIRTQDGLANGSPGIIKKIIIPQNDSPTIIVWMSFDTTDVGRSQRQDHRQYYTKEIDNSWTPITSVSRRFTVGNKQVLVNRRQVPLRPASAKTVHRSQGDTLNSVVVSLVGRKFAHLHYVALSRVKTLDGLYILDFNEKNIKTDPAVKAEMHRLRNQASLNPALTFLYSLSRDRPIILFHNARSLHKHLPDAKVDYNIRAAHLAIFCETRFWKYDSSTAREMDSFSLFTSNAPITHPGQRPAHGIAAYTTETFEPGYPLVKNFNRIEMILIRISAWKLNIVAVYRPPSVATKTLLLALARLHDNLPKDFPTIVLGDFNINWLETQPRHQLQQLMEITFHYKQQITSPTTDYGTCLDHIYFGPSVTGCAATMESYYSDHKPVWCQID